MKKRKDGRYQTSVYLGTDDEGRKNIGAYAVKLKLR